jgi:hypothetical protein
VQGPDLRRVVGHRLGVGPGAQQQRRRVRRVEERRQVQGGEPVAGVLGDWCAGRQHRREGGDVAEPGRVEHVQFRVGGEHGLG